MDYQKSERGIQDHYGSEDKDQKFNSTLWKSNPSSAELEEFRIQLIERKIGKEQLSKEDYSWHTSRICWGCGKRHTTPFKMFKARRVKQESWKKGGFRHYKNFVITDDIPLCPECYNRLSVARRVQNKNDELFEKINYILRILFGILCGGIAITTSGSSAVHMKIIYFIFAVLAGTGIASTLGQIVLYPISKGIVHLVNNERIDDKTKWSFDNIPRIYRFLNVDQHK